MSVTDAEGLGQRGLGTTEALAQTLAIAPVASVAFASYLVASYAGAATPFAIALAFGGSIALGWVVAGFGRRFAGAGTVYEYLGRAGRPMLALTAAGAYFLVELIGASGVLSSSLLIQAFCQSELGFDPGWWTGGVLVMALVLFSIHHGVRGSARLALALTGLSAIPLVILGVSLLATSDHTLSVFDPGRGDVVQGLIYAVVLFLGFEAAACLGEESRNPHRTIPRAIIAGIAVSGIFYLVMFYALTIGFGPESVQERWGGDPLAVIALGDERVGRPLSALIQLGVIVDIIAFLIAVDNVTARGYYALARDGFLPRRLATVSRHGTPLGGTVVVAGAHIAILAAAAFVAGDRFRVFDASFSAPPIVVLTVYLVLCALGARLALREGRPRRVLVWFGLGATVPALGLYGSLNPFPEGPRLVGLGMAVAALAVATAWALYLRARRPDAVHRIAGHALDSLENR